MKLETLGIFTASDFDASLQYLTALRCLHLSPQIIKAAPATLPRMPKFRCGTGSAGPTCGIERGLPKSFSTDDDNIVSSLDLSKPRFTSVESLTFEFAQCYQAFERGRQDESLASEHFGMRFMQVLGLLQGVYEH